MASTLLDGKTYAGNPYVQIEEGNGASAKPRRLFPLYRKQFLIGWVVAAVTGVTAFAEVATTTLRAESFAGKSATAGIQQAIDAATAKGGGKRRRREIESERKAKGKRISGLPIAFQNDRENDLRPRRAAPVGALCEKCHPKAQ